MRMLLIVLNIILVALFAIAAPLDYINGEYFKFGTDIFCALCWLGCAILNTCVYIKEKKSR